MSKDQSQAAGNRQQNGRDDNRFPPLKTVGHGGYDDAADDSAKRSIFSRVAPYSPAAIEATGE